MGDKRCVHNKHDTSIFMLILLHRHISAGLPWLVAHQFHSGLPWILILCPCNGLQVHQHIRWSLRGVMDLCCCQCLFTVGGLCTVVTVSIRCEGRVVYSCGFWSGNWRTSEKTNVSKEHNPKQRQYIMFQTADDIQWFASHTQPNYKAKLSMARICPGTAKRKYAISHSALAQHEHFASVNGPSMCLLILCCLVYSVRKGSAFLILMKTSKKSGLEPYLSKTYFKTLA